MCQTASVDLRRPRLFATRRLPLAFGFGPGPVFGRLNRALLLRRPRTLGWGLARRLPHWLLLLGALGLGLTRLLLRTLRLHLLLLLHALRLDLAHLLFLLRALGFLCLLLRLHLRGAGCLFVLRLLALGILLAQSLFALRLFALHWLLLHRWLVRHGLRRLHRCCRGVWHHDGLVARGP